jgi:dihydrofolate reductase
MNAMSKLVVSGSLKHADGWQNSAVLRGDLATEVEKRKAEDIVVMGNASVVHTLMAHDLVDEYRLLVFPLVLGAGTRLFPDGAAPADLALVSAQARGVTARLFITGQVSPDAPRASVSIQVFLSVCFLGDAGCWAEVTVGLLAARRVLGSGRIGW